MHYIGDLFLNDVLNSVFYNHMAYNGYFFSRINNDHKLTYYINSRPPGIKI